MSMVKLQRGDFFCSRNPMALGRAIMAIEKIWANDNKAVFSHAGIVTDENGTTLEALGRIKGNSLDAYKGDNVLVLRWEGMNIASFWKGMEAVKEDIGKFYPYWRLPLFIVPILAKYISTGKFPVCSELTCKFLIGAGMPDIGEWTGQNPDDVADMSKWKIVSTVYEGVWQ